MSETRKKVEDRIEYLNVQKTYLEDTLAYFNNTINELIERINLKWKI